MLDTVIIAIRGFVLLVLTVPHCPPAIGALDQPGENLRGAVLPLPAAAGYALLYPVKIRFADNGLVGVLHLPPFILGLAHPLLALERHGCLLVVYAVPDVRFIQEDFRTWEIVHSYLRPSGWPSKMWAKVPYRWKFSHDGVGICSVASMWVILAAPAPWRASA